MSITHPSDKLQFIVSNGLVTNGPLQDGKPWTLGNFIEELKGAQAKSKRTFGVSSGLKKVFHIHGHAQKASLINCIALYTIYRYAVN